MPRYGSPLLSGSVKFLYDEDINDYISCLSVSNSNQSENTGMGLFRFVTFGLKFAISLDRNSPSRDPPVNWEMYSISPVKSPL
ncbi:MAG: hypothetical protein IPH45_19510 [Bacteroidales bacterium]|nr:hypothetical protein [Bacteroidales bacterium]